RPRARRGDARRAPADGARVGATDRRGRTGGDAGGEARDPAGARAAPRGGAGTRTPAGGRCPAGGVLMGAGLWSRSRRGRQVPAWAGPTALLVVSAFFVGVVLWGFFRP